MALLTYPDLLTVLDGLTSHRSWRMLDYLAGQRHWLEVVAAHQDRRQVSGQALAESRSQTRARSSQRRRSARS